MGLEASGSFGFSSVELVPGVAVAVVVVAAAASSSAARSWSPEAIDVRFPVTDLGFVHCGGEVLEEMGGCAREEDEKCGEVGGEMVRVVIYTSQSTPPRSLKACLVRGDMSRIVCAENPPRSEILGIHLDSRAYRNDGMTSS